MGLYGFKRQFRPYILDGTKRHTIRGERKHADLPGSIMHLYCGLRSVNAELLMRVPCAAVQRVQIFRSVGEIAVMIGGERLHPEEMNRLAWLDGFRPEGSTEREPGESFELMAAFWERNHRLSEKPFAGEIYHWDPERAIG